MQSEGVTNIDTYRQTLLDAMLGFFLLFTMEDNGRVSWAYFTVLPGRQFFSTGMSNIIQLFRKKKRIE